MWFEYSEWREEGKKGKLGFEDLLQIFNQLLIQNNGDVGEALQWMQMLGEKYGFFDGEYSIEDFIRDLEREGLIKPNEKTGTYNITPKGGHQIRQDSLKQIFSSLKKSPLGSHETPLTGEGVDRLSETKPYQFGDSPTDLDFTATINNALRRAGIDEIDLKEEDLEVYETEHMTSCATVLMLDVSHSMILYGEDRITPAKRVALALAELILTQFPKDHLSVILFGDDAKEVPIEDLPYVTVGPYYTNTKAGLQLARKILLRKKNVNRQIFMVTDGKPSAIWDEGRLYRNAWGLDRRIVAKTLDEAVICRRHKIVITTFMVARDPMLVDFVKRLTELNRGRAYYSSANKLGEYIFVDYIRNRRRRVS
ncbi:MAG: vWA domain-containing protein [bacterium]